jgi:hypothetical protein
LNVSLTRFSIPIHSTPRVYPSPLHNPVCGAHRTRAYAWATLRLSFFSAWTSKGWTEKTSRSRLGKMRALFLLVTSGLVPDTRRILLTAFVFLQRIADLWSTRLVYIKAQTGPPEDHFRSQPQLYPENAKSTSVVVSPSSPLTVSFSLVYRIATHNGSASVTSPAPRYSPKANQLSYKTSTVSCIWDSLAELDCQRETGGLFDLSFEVLPHKARFTVNIPYCSCGI